MSQFTFNRDAHLDLTHYMSEGRIPEEDNEDDSDDDVDHLHDSSGCSRPKLNSVDDGDFTHSSISVDAICYWNENAKF